MGGLILYYFDPKLANYFVPICAAVFLIFIGSIISILTFLFVYKLMNVHMRTSDGLNSDSSVMIATITKISILSLISITSYVFSTVVSFIMFTFDAIDTTNGQFIWLIIGTSDIYTNFISIILTFKTFDPFYLKVCGCCDVRCKLLCQSCTNRRLMKMEQMEKAVSKSSELSTSGIEIVV